MNGKKRYANDTEDIRDEEDGSDGQVRYGDPKCKNDESDQWDMP